MFLQKVGQAKEAGSMTLNVPEAEERARLTVGGYGEFSRTAEELLALAALARELAQQLHGEAVATGEAYSGTREVLAKARAAGLLPAREKESR